MVQVRKWNYGNYSSNNYGAHCVAIEVGKLTLYFSYNTVIAFTTLKDGLVISENVWSTTTGKHLNWINEYKQHRISNDEFTEKLNEVLKEHNLNIN